MEMKINIPSRYYGRAATFLEKAVFFEKVIEGHGKVMENHGWSWKSHGKFFSMQNNFAGKS
jgi:hypothetical protein